MEEDRRGTKLYPPPFLGPDWQRQVKHIMTRDAMETKEVRTGCAHPLVATCSRKRPRRGKIWNFSNW